jgi:hypothetical protein
VAKQPSVRWGAQAPRIAPPLPVRSELASWKAAAKAAAIRPLPWQETAARYAMATGPKGKWLWPTFVLVVARQNGKSTILIPRILRALSVGERVVHTAQDRALPREIFERVADLVPNSQLRRRPRLANGQERIDTWSGGVYRIVAPTRAGARGPSNDLVIIDEARELDDYAFIAAARPTLTASRNPQTWYLSNAGDETSVVLNGLRQRAVELGDDALAFLEWSAAPGRDLDDRRGWAEANPSLGRLIDLSTLAQFRKDYIATPTVFQTEHLCQWVGANLPRLVDDVAWQRAARPTETPLRPCLGVAQTAGRVVGIIAWTQSDGTIGLRLAADVAGDPVDVDRAGAELRALAERIGVVAVGYAPSTDRDVARHLDLAGVDREPISGQTAEAAASRFVATLQAGRLAWQDAELVGADLAMTVRKAGSAPGTYAAAQGAFDRPIPAALAAIYAVWLATAPRDNVPTVH